MSSDLNSYPRAVRNAVYVLRNTPQSGLNFDGVCQQDADELLRLFGVFGDVQRELDRQHILWGEQNHPDGTCFEWDDVATQRKEVNDGLHKSGKLTWLHILAEEVFEAFAETDRQKLRTELVQVAAVAMQWVKAIDRGTR